LGDSLVEFLALLEPLQISPLTHRILLGQGFEEITVEEL
jgi:hypothetical protein